MTRRRLTFSTMISIVLLLCSVLTADEATTSPAPAAVLDVAALRSALHSEGTLDNGVLTVTYPRSDLHVTIDDMPVPTEAGLASHMWFYRCPCGRTRMVGEFVLCDYETDDVVQAIHGDPDGHADIRVDAVAPMFSAEKPAMRIVRIHGEGQPEALAARVLNAMQYIGGARNAKSTTMPASK